jgi:hypothetical protein
MHQIKVTVFTLIYGAKHNNNGGNTERGPIMNKKHLGDAFDYWKGSLILILTQKHKLISNLIVVPMITDDELWKEKQWQKYRTILNLLKKNSVWNEKKFKNPQKSRHEYFTSIPADCDIFLDPDTGVSFGKRKKEHIAINDIQCLLNNVNDNRVLMVYQHARHNRNRAEQDCNMLKKQIHGTCCYPHECGQVTMFFISRDKKRIQKIKKALEPYRKANMG